METLLRLLEAEPERYQTTRWLFGLVCVQRVAHLIEQEEVLACLQAFSDALDRGDAAAMPALARRVAQLANGHHGSRSLDGVGHAAVSATYAFAKAVAGLARQAAEYAAYAAVYGGGGYGATSDPASFEPEYAWQARQLQALLDAGVLGAQG